jgi:hypothetical protein
LKLNNTVKVHFVISVIFFLTSVTYSQNVYNGFLQEFYLGRQPSVKAEAMGRGLVAYPEYEFSSWYNPSSVALSDRITAYGSYSSPYYILKSAYYYYAGASYNSGKYGAIGFNRFYMAEKIIAEKISSPDDIANALYSINYAYQPVNDFYAGINFNILTLRFPPIIVTDVNPDQTLYPIDIGVLKIFQIQNTVHTTQKFTVGSSLYNVTNVKYNTADANQSETLPVILRLGASYNFQHTQRKGADELKTINLYAYTEVEDLLNSRYNTVFRVGAEVTSLEIFSARLGYFTQNLNNYGNSGNLSEQHQVTYGFGLQAPLTKITKGALPLNVRFDYTSLPQPSYSQSTDWKNFNSYSISLRWEKPLFNF